MSRNPYLAATRPSSSYTRSSRTSKRNDFTPSSRTSSSLLGRSRSSASLAGGLSSVNFGTGSSSYSSSAYTPSWQRSSSTNRLVDRQGSDLSTKSQSATTTNLPLYKSTSSHNLASFKQVENDNDKEEDSNHLQNYQQSKLEQQQEASSGRSGSRPISSQLETADSITSLDSPTGAKLSYDESESIRSGSAPKHLRQGGNLMKTQSLDAGQQALDTSSLLTTSMSVDRLLLRSETMSERDLRKSYKELVMENEKLKRHLKGLDDREKQKQQDWIRKERQLERKISELEEENKQLEQWRIESQRLKDENSSLIRVLSKISKKHN